MATEQIYNPKASVFDELGMWLINRLFDFFFLFLETASRYLVSNQKTHCDYIKNLLPGIDLNKIMLFCATS